jgi:hypothetical protein
MPLAQVSHCWLHCPQFCVSFWRSTHWPPHGVSPGRHTQAAPLQSWSELHAWPHWPQLVGLLWRLTQALPPQSWPAQAHTLLAQVSPCAHGVVQLPQNLGSVAVSAQVPLQLVFPAGHTHWPDTHVSPGLQAWLHPPQLSGSEAGVTQPTAPPQSMAPPLQVHWPDTQVPAGPQALPHAPQFLLSVETSAHAPCAAQARVPVGQGPHWPEMHFAPVRQAAPQAPQLAGSLESSAQPDGQVTKPVAQLQVPPLQVAPGLHGPFPPQSQAPALQVPPAQSTPQAPQLAGSAAVSTQLVPQAVLPPVQLPPVPDVPVEVALPEPPLPEDEDVNRPVSPLLPHPAGAARVQAETRANAAAAKEGRRSSMVPEGAGAPGQRLTNHAASGAKVWDDEW